MSRFVMALDQGTTSSRAILFERSGAIVAVDQYEFPQYFPQPGWVEHDPDEIWESQLRAARGALEKAGATGSDVAAIGITNQRETAVVWDRGSGAPIHPAIVWQSRQTAPICDELRSRGLEDEVRARTGLVIDAYFSGTKIRFILDAVEGAQARAERGELCFGTVDSWLLHRLTKGRVHATEFSNASRTLVFNIHERDWDDVLLGELRIPRAILPEVRDTSGIFGVTDSEWFGAEIPIAGIAGDQQAALFGQGCVAQGQAKNTYGTGCFLLMNTGAEAPASRTGLVTTIGWGIGEEIAYALEGSIFVAGAAVQWLRDGLGFLASAADSFVRCRAMVKFGIAIELSMNSPVTPPMPPKPAVGERVCMKMPSLSAMVHEMEGFQSWDTPLSAKLGMLSGTPAWWPRPERRPARNAFAIRPRPRLVSS